MPETVDRICANCSSFFPDTFKATENGICLADKTFKPYLDELLNHGNFTVCKELIKEKRFHGGQDACPLYDEVEMRDFQSGKLDEMIGRLLEQKL
jgi:hypothetical protein